MTTLRIAVEVRPADRRAVDRAASAAFVADAHRPPPPGQEDEDENETPIGDPDDDDWEGEDWDEDDDEPLRAGWSPGLGGAGSRRGASRTDPAKRR